MTAPSASHNLQGCIRPCPGLLYQGINLSNSPAHLVSRTLTLCHMAVVTLCLRTVSVPDVLSAGLQNRATPRDLLIKKMGNGKEAGEGGKSQAHGEGASAWSHRELAVQITPQFALTCSRQPAFHKPTHSLPGQDPCQEGQMYSPGHFCLSVPVGKAAPLAQVFEEGLRC